MYKDLNEIPSFLRKPTNYKPTPIRKLCSKKVNHEKLHRANLSKGWADAKWNELDTRFVFWKPIIRGRYKNKIKYRHPHKQRTYLMDKEKFLAKIK
jgi:hypothetical protein